VCQKIAGESKRVSSDVGNVSVMFDYMYILLHNGNLSASAELVNSTEETVIRNYCAYHVMIFTSK
jgi:hypothetical protein